MGRQMFQSPGVVWAMDQKVPSSWEIEASTKVSDSPCVCPCVPIYAEKGAFSTFFRCSPGS